MTFSTIGWPSIVRCRRGDKSADAHPLVLGTSTPHPPPLPSNVIRWRRNEEARALLLDGARGCVCCFFLSHLRRLISFPPTNGNFFPRHGGRPDHPMRGVGGRGGADTSDRSCSAYTAGEASSTSTSDPSPRMCLVHPSAASLSEQKCPRLLRMRRCAAAAPPPQGLKLIFSRLLPPPSPLRRTAKIALWGDDVSCRTSPHRHEVGGWRLGQRQAKSSIASQRSPSVWKCPTQQSRGCDRQKSAISKASGLSAVAVSSFSDAAEVL